MGKAQSKQLLKRKAARAWVHLDNAAEHLAGMYPIFADTHKDLADMLEALAKQILIVQSELEDFWRICWGELPQDMHNWT